MPRGVTLEEKTDKSQEDTKFIQHCVLKAMGENGQKTMEEGRILKQVKKTFQLYKKRQQ